jgi:hypothetical protein
LVGVAGLRVALASGKEVGVALTALVVAAVDFAAGVALAVGEAVETRVGVGVTETKTI